VHPEALCESHYLTLLFKNSLKEGKVPKAWKDANIKPIQKKGSKTNPGNYCPISLTSLFSKTLEKFIKEILHHMIINNLLGKAYGFRSNHSCVLQLEAMEAWTKSLDD